MGLGLLILMLWRIDLFMSAKVCEKCGKLKKDGSGLVIGGVDYCKCEDE